MNEQQKAQVLGQYRGMSAKDREWWLLLLWAKLEEAYQREAMYQRVIDTSWKEVDTCKSQGTGV